MKFTLIGSKKSFKIGRGDRFRHGNEMYMLAECSSNNLILISLEDGRRWSSSAIKVVDTLDISDGEWNALTLNSKSEFLLSKNNNEWEISVDTKS